MASYAVGDLQLDLDDVAHAQVMSRFGGEYEIQIALADGVTLAVSDNEPNAWP